MGGKVRVENLTISKESKSNSGTDQIRSDFPGTWEETGCQGECVSKLGARMRTEGRALLTKRSHMGVQMGRGLLRIVQWLIKDCSGL